MSDAAGGREVRRGADASLCLSNEATLSCWRSRHSPQRSFDSGPEDRSRRGMRRLQPLAGVQREDAPGLSHEAAGPRGES